MRNVASTIYLLTSAAIALGAFGHDSNAAKLAAEFAKAPALDPDVVRVTMLVWHFCSGCMLVFGAICVLSWWRLRTGARDALPVPLAIGAFYIVTGIASVAYSAKPFFWLFTVLGSLLVASACVLRAVASRP